MCLAFRRFILLAVGIPGLVLGLWFFALPAYRHLKERRAVACAQACFASGDLRNANLCARRALSINPTNLAACLLMAQMAEAAHASVALDWRRRIAEFSPTLEHKLAVAQTALAIESLPIASQTLKDLLPAATNFVHYHVLAAQLALKPNHLDEAAGHFTSAARMQPENPLHRLNLSVTQLLFTNQADADSARATLQLLVNDTHLAPFALRSLVADSLRRKRFTDAEAFSKSLLANPRAYFSDQLQHLTVLREAGWPEFEAAVARLQHNVTSNALDTWSLANWMNRNGLASRALAWLTDCPTRVQSNRPVPLAIADSYVACGNWTGLETFLQSQSWSDIEFARLALLARAAFARENRVGCEAYWRLAIRQASPHLGPLTTLLALANDWNFPEVRLSLLAEIVENFPRERWAYRELVPLYLAAGNTRALNRISELVASGDPQDIVARNNFAGTSLLLKINLEQAHRLAKENLAGRPEDPILVATYAYSLHLQGRTREGLAALENLEADSLTDPSTALYYGFLLNATHQFDRATSVLAVVKRTALLPEERQLLREVEREN